MKLLNTQPIPDASVKPLSPLEAVADSLGSRSKARIYRSSTRCCMALRRKYDKKERAIFFPQATMVLPSFMGLREIGVDYCKAY